jgi:hypothetical protein
VAPNQAVTKTGKTQNSALDQRTTRHQGYGMSQSRRAMTECIFGWGKQHGTMRKTKHRGIAGVAAGFMLNLIAYNLISIPKLVCSVTNRGSRPPKRFKLSNKSSQQRDPDRTSVQFFGFFSKLLVGRTFHDDVASLVSNGNR